MAFSKKLCPDHHTFLSFWLVRNLSCDPEQVEGFPTSGNDTENRHTISSHYDQTPCGLCRRVVHGFVKKPHLSLRGAKRRSNLF